MSRSGRKRKLSLYFPREVLAEIQGQADRLERSVSWVIEAAWRIARDELRAGKPKIGSRTRT